MNNLHPIAQAVQSQGRGKDTQLVHMTPNEVQGLHALAKAHGGSLSINPSTGLPEAGFLDSMLPTILGVGLAAATGGTSLALTPGMIGLGIGGLQYMRTGSLEKGLMAGIGAYGGAGMAGSLGLGASGAAGGVGSGATVAAPTIDPNAAANIGANAATNPANFSLADGASRSGMGLNAASHSAMTAPSSFAIAPPAAPITPLTPMPAAAGSVPASPYALSSQPTMMDKLGSGQFWKDNWQSAAAAAAPTVMDSMTPAVGPGYTPDNEQFQYDYNPNRATQEQIDAQRAAYAARGITGGEIDYFNPVYEGPNKVRVAQGGELKYAGGGIFGRAVEFIKTHVDAQSSKSGGEGHRYTYDPTTQKYTRLAGGGLLSLVEGGMPNDYEYDPVSQTYKKVVQAPTAAVAPIGVPNAPQETVGSDRPVELTKQQIDFLDNEDKSPGGARDQRMGKISDIIGMLAPGSMVRALVGGANSLTGGGAGQPRAPVTNLNTRSPEAVAESESQSVTSDPTGATETYGDTSMGTLFAKGGIAGLAAGGMAKGGFVVPADVVSALGNGSSDAGLRKLYALIGDVKPIKGNGDGLSDSIPTSIDGRQPARVADGEAYVNPKTVAKIGGGDAKKGAKKLYAMMDKIRQQAHGKKTQQRKVNAKAVV